MDKLTDEHLTWMETACQTSTSMSVEAETLLALVAELREGRRTLEVGPRSGKVRGDAIRHAYWCPNCDTALHRIGELEVPMHHCRNCGVRLTWKE